MYLRVYAKMQRNHSCTSKIRKTHILANSVMTPYFFMQNRNKAEPREVTKQVVWIILRNRIFHKTIRHIRSGFPSYARTLCELTLFAYALKPMSWDLWHIYVHHSHRMLVCFRGNSDFQRTVEMTQRGVTIDVSQTEHSMMQVKVTSMQ